MKIRHLLFDLDNTLYPSTAAMDLGITQRMLGFTAKLLGVSYDEAVEKRKERLPLYGTTLEWLKKEHGLEDVDAYFSAVHPPEEVNELTKDDNLRPLLQSLNLPMTILTNAPRRHAERVLNFLNVADLFISIHDIESNNFRGKPYPESYRKAIETSGFTVDETIFFDDHKKYTDGYNKIGGISVLICHPEKKLDKNIHPLDSLICDDCKTIQISSVYEIPQLLQKLDNL